MEDGRTRHTNGQKHDHDQGRSYHKTRLCKTFSPTKTGGKRAHRYQILFLRLMYRTHYAGDFERIHEELKFERMNFRIANHCHNNGTYHT